MITSSIGSNLKIPNLEPSEPQKTEPRTYQTSCFLLKTKPRTYQTSKPPKNQTANLPNLQKLNRTSNRTRFDPTLPCISQYQVGVGRYIYVENQAEQQKGEVCRAHLRRPTTFKIKLHFSEVGAHVVFPSKVFDYQGLCLRKIKVVQQNRKHNQEGPFTF